MIKNRIINKKFKVRPINRNNYKNDDNNKGKIENINKYYLNVYSTIEKFCNNNITPNPHIRLIYYALDRCARRIIDHHKQYQDLHFTLKLNKGADSKIFIFEYNRKNIQTLNMGLYANASHGHTDEYTVHIFCMKLYDYLPGSFFIFTFFISSFIDFL